ncbi:MAG: ABC-F family ATP-binding cassette domain-containing protein [Proteobacteria bacterium]|nr:ABC-F family ATP-binding cassette domain-containing protein [Pseudomonadota bacterium]
MISIESLSKGFGGQELLDQVSLKINARERVGLVGRNGHGKTTLMKIIIGEEHQDSGSIIIPGNYRLGHVRQHLEFTENTVLGEGILGLRDHEKDHHWKVEKLLDGLGFSPADFQRNPRDFSGGYQVRLNLVKVLVSEPDLLLLDEPTNYLDITSIRWMVKFLNQWPRELLLITHDRSFMDAVVTHTAGIHRLNLRKIKGNTEKYYSQVAQDEEIYEKTRVNDEKRRKELDLFISRFRAKARLANMVQSRVKTLAKMEKKDKLGQVGELEFSFRSKPFPAKIMLQAENISFSYESANPLIQNVNLTIAAGDRICIVGKNGKGKTTLLKVLAGELEKNSGSISSHPSVEKGFYEQTNVKSLVDARTVEEEILYSHPDVDRQHARGICGAMMFEGDLALKKISVLSGGEKSRVMLGKLLVTPLNLLFLDEPTNHLDMEACDSLLGAIDNCEGAVVMVTHNEMFLHALAEKLVVFKNDRIHIFEGSYADFLEKEGWDDETTGRVDGENRETQVAQDDSAKLGKKELRKLRSDIIQRKSKELKPIEKKIEVTENTIEKLENEIAELNRNLLDVSGLGDGKKIAELSKQLHEKQTAVDDYFDKLQNLADSYDSIKAKYDLELETIEGE